MPHKQKMSSIQERKISWNQAPRPRRCRHCNERYGRGIVRLHSLGASWAPVGSEAWDPVQNEFSAFWCPRKPVMANTNTEKTHNT